MAFVKGNKLGEKQKGVPKARTQQWDNIVGWLVGEGGVAFKQKLQHLSTSVEITKEEEKFMDYYMSLLEFHQPKLARKEITGKDGKELPIPIMGVIITDDDNKPA